MGILHVVFVFLYVVVSVSGINFCPRGMYPTGGGCALCPPGSFQGGWFIPTDRCTPCPAGTFTPYYGVGTPDMCWNCPMNTYSEANATVCKACPKGLVSGEGFSSCISCDPGTYPVGKAYGKSKCANCRPGTYKQNMEHAECTECPNDLASPIGAKSVSDCFECPAGKEKSSYHKSGCVGCSFGSYKPSASKDYCKVCPLGFIAPFRGAKKCIPCTKGTRSNAYRTKCIPCPEGYTTYSKGQSVCRKIDNVCPNYTVESPTGDCLKCTSGYFLSEDLKCRPCPPGSRSLGGKARSCIECPGRQIPERGDQSCRCPPGEYFSTPGICTKCPPGTHINNNIQVYGKPSCVACTENFIGPGWGNTKCTQCPEGFIGNPDGTKCVKCARGLTASTLYNGGSECVNITTGCPAGYKRFDVGVRCVRQSCKLDTPAEEVGKTCLPCDKGYAFLVPGKGCRMCPKGYVSDGGIIAECRKCPNGLQKDAQDWSKCSCATSGYGLQNGTCKKCPPGYLGEWEEDTCEECAPGSFTAKFGSDYCEKCPPNSFKDKAGPGKCKLCPNGLIGNKKEGATKCVKPY